MEYGIGTMRSGILVGVMAAAASAGPVYGAGVMHVTVQPRESPIGPGDLVIFDIWADWSGVTGGVMFAGFKFDVLGHANGTLRGSVNAWDLDQFPQNGTSVGPHLLNFSCGQLPIIHGGDYFANPAFLGSVIYTESGVATKNYTITPSIIEYTGPAGGLHVYVNSSGGQSRSSVDTDTGNFHLVTFTIGSYDVIVPAPGTAMGLLTGLMAVGRRRR